MDANKIAELEKKVFYLEEWITLISTRLNGSTSVDEFLSNNKRLAATLKKLNDSES